MRVNRNNIIGVCAVILFGLLSGTSAYAQFENDPSASELRDPNQSTESNFTDDKPLIVDHDRGSRLRDSTHVKSITPKVKSSEAVKPSSNKEEDALSFNFLYYIIQKFKISDLVDE